jgi:hypothetical protein
VAWAAVLFQFLWPARYRFPPPTPFQGPVWCNPYAEFRGPTLRANFHAHARAWLGLTYGRHDRSEVARRYREAGYQVACISDYQDVAPPQPDQEVYLPAYEHGLTLGQQHYTVIGSSGAIWFDFPLPWQTLEAKQNVIEALAASAELVIINHPNKKEAFSVQDFARLTGYDAVEVATRFAQNRGYWDAALSAGRLVWGTASDDGHDPDRAGHIGRHWMDIDADPDPDSVLAAFRAGRFYSTRREDKFGEEQNALQQCRIEDGVLEVRLTRPADFITFVGQGGSLLGSVVDRAVARRPLGPEDSYVRVEIVTEGLRQYLNPVVRSTGGMPARLHAERRDGATRGRRILAGVLLPLPLVIRRVWRRRRRQP